MCQSSCVPEILLQKKKSTAAGALVWFSLFPYRKFFYRFIRIIFVQMT